MDKFIKDEEEFIEEEEKFVEEKEYIKKGEKRKTIKGYNENIKNLIKECENYKFKTLKSEEIETETTAIGNISIGFPNMKRKINSYEIVRNKMRANALIKSMKKLEIQNKNTTLTSKLEKFEESIPSLENQHKEILEDKGRNDADILGSLQAPSNKSLYSFLYSRDM